MVFAQWLKTIAQKVTIFQTSVFYRPPSLLVLWTLCLSAFFQKCLNKSASASELSVGMHRNCLLEK
ncbi:uncharacterized protein CELE_F52D2.5 [Caenorhabditis elegans]|uniref:Secreted protein n=1 Tax=Caenorhabditis elegans TaxID=6239 RepID=Q9TXM4_CAEEL|nr:Secreted protein [Caenorhabditis elegans]CCD71643.1 Secreted protein [Caenorhabditis elegans]|eukprot:NP_508364.2 Uncharacterized protein CELE_F52D2.5 [Caenorhabditis elegans]